MSKSKPRFTHEQVAAWIHKIFEDERGPSPQNLTAWTGFVATELAEQAELHGCEAWGCHVDRMHPEYLVDQCWSVHVRDRGDGYWSKYDGLVFAAEFEWGGTRSAVWQDFVKLLDVKADARLFIASLWPRVSDDRDKLIRQLRGALVRHRHATEADWVVLALCRKAHNEEPGIWLLECGTIATGKEPRRWLGTRWE